MGGKGERGPTHDCGSSDNDDDIGHGDDIDKGMVTLRRVGPNQLMAASRVDLSQLISACRLETKCVDISDSFRDRAVESSKSSRT